MCAPHFSNAALVPFQRDTPLRRPRWTLEHVDILNLARCYAKLLLHGVYTRILCHVAALGAGTGPTCQGYLGDA